MELLIGCGASRTKRVPWNNDTAWHNLVTLDINEAAEPDVLHDLADIPLPFNDNLFDEIHAYDVLEHMGQQGDWRFFFRQFDDFWRVLKPGGMLCGISPAPKSPWAWGDPGHTRVISRECLSFLDRDAYAQVGKTAMTDYRPFFTGSFRLVGWDERDCGSQIYVLQAVKN